MLGFAAQLAEALGVEASWLCLGVTVPFAVALVILGLVALRFTRRWHVRNNIEYLLRLGERRDAHLSEWPNVIDTMARRLGRERAQDETPEQVAIRILGEKRWRRLTEGIDVPESVTRTE